MNHIFVDTSAWLAIANPRDKYHFQASKAYREHLVNFDFLVTTNLVLAETYSLALYRIGARKTQQLLNGIRKSSRIEQVYTTSEIDKLAFDILEKYDDQEFSLIDAVSFVIMQQRELAQVFSYDHHFSVMGFLLNN